MKNLGYLLSPLEKKQGQKDLKTKKEGKSFQLRHSKLGLFQGYVQGSYFWHPFSDSPEFGIFELRSKAIANQLKLQMEELFENNEAYPGETFQIEEYDLELHKHLLVQGEAILQACRIMVPGKA